MSEEWNNDVQETVTETYTADSVSVEGGEVKTPGYGTAALIMSIAGIVLALVGCCCGFPAFIGLALGIAATIMGSKATKEMNEKYGQASGAVKAAKIIGIIAIVLSVLIIAGNAIVGAIYGVSMLSEMSY